jgi:hypothetical protein
MDQKERLSIEMDLKDFARMENISRDSQRPVYKVNLSSKRLVALTLLAYAVTDDRDGTNCLNDCLSPG